MKRIGLSLFLFFAIPLFAFASNIDATNKYARFLSTNALINFGTTNGNVVVTSSAVTGYAWGTTVGWINLSPTNGGVVNDGHGVLSGYAWGENTGWINFKPTNGGVTIDSSGNFSGYAWSETKGWIVFNCATDSSCGALSHKVQTTWVPSATVVTSPTTTTVTPDSGGPVGLYGTVNSQTPPSLIPTLEAALKLTQPTSTPPTQEIPSVSVPISVPPQIPSQTTTQTPALTPSQITTQIPGQTSSQLLPPSTTSSGSGLLQPPVGIYSGSLSNGGTSSFGTINNNQTAQPTSNTLIAVKGMKAFFNGFVVQVNSAIARALDFLKNIFAGNLVVSTASKTFSLAGVALILVALVLLFVLIKFGAILSAVSSLFSRSTSPAPKQQSTKITPEDSENISTIPIEPTNPNPPSENQNQTTQ